MTYEEPMTKPFVGDEWLWLRHCRKLWKGKQFHSLDFDKITRHNSALELGLLGAKTWKDEYGFSLVDSKRTRMTEEELCRIKWNFSFHYNGRDAIPVRFLSDHRFEMHGQREMTWRITPHHQVQVQQYPPMTLTRRSSDWGWFMRNNYVVFSSEDAAINPSAPKEIERPGLLALRGPPPGMRPVLIRVGNAHYVVMGTVNDRGQLEIDDEIIQAFENDPGENDDDIEVHDGQNEEAAEGEGNEGGEGEGKEGDDDDFVDAMEAEDTSHSLD